MNVDFSKWTPQSIIAGIIALAVVGTYLYMLAVGKTITPDFNILFSLVFGGGLFAMGHAVGASTTLDAQQNTPPPQIVPVPATTPSQPQPQPQPASGNALPPVHPIMVTPQPQQQTGGSGNG